MNSLSFNDALEAYQKGDFTEALKGFYNCLQWDSDTFLPGELGLVYYRLGNCLLKLRNFAEAAATYQKALEDADYSDHAAVEVNLGKALIGTGDFRLAVDHFNLALADTRYNKPFQAQMGLGTAYSRLGMVIEAGTAYRNAALDDRNPNPTKALLNLGSCFTLLKRPQDAIEAYNAVFEFNPTGSTLFKTWENLGRAFVSTGRYQEAVSAFASALGVGKYSLSDEAQSDYLRAQKALTSAPAMTYSGAGQYSNDIGEFDPFAPSDLNNVVQGAYPELDFVDEVYEDYGAGNVPSASDTDFFTVPDSALIDMSKRQMKKERRMRHTGLKVLLVIVILLVLVLGAAVFAFSQGYGWPTQASVVQSLFTDHAAGKDVSIYWAFNSEDEKDDIDRIMDMVAPTDQIEVVYEDRQFDSTEIVVLAHLSQGGTIKYDITLKRDMIGWKIAGLDLLFDSTQL